MYGSILYVIPGIYSSQQYGTRVYATTRYIRNYNRAVVPEAHHNSASTLHCPSHSGIGPQELSVRAPDARREVRVRL